jgi:hypothetical protein
MGVRTSAARMLCIGLHGAQVSSAHVVHGTGGDMVVVKYGYHVRPIYRNLIAPVLTASTPPRTSYMLIVHDASYILSRSVAAQCSLP